VDAEFRGRFRACLERCDFARFVPEAGQESRRSEVAQEATALIEALEKVL
jgi:hypothetical protein